MFETFPDELTSDAEARFTGRATASDDLLFDISFDQALTRDNPLIALYHWGKFEFDDSQKIEKEAWEENFSRPDTEWFDGMTVYQAQIVRDEHDHQVKYNRILDSVDGWNASSLGGYFAGSLIDPLNYLPWSSFLSKSMQVMKLAKQGAVVSLTASRKPLGMIGDAVFGSFLGERAIEGKRASHQLEYDASMMYINMAMAGGAGALFAGVSKVARTLNKQSVLENVGQAGKALDDMARGKSPEVDGSAFTAIRNVYDQLIHTPMDKFKQILKNEGALLAETPEAKIVVAKGAKIIEQGKKELSVIKDFINCRMK